MSMHRDCKARDAVTFKMGKLSSILVVFVQLELRLETSISPKNSVTFSLGHISGEGGRGPFTKEAKIKLLLLAHIFGPTSKALFSSELATDPKLGP